MSSLHKDLLFARWLISKGRTEAALGIIKTAADVNKVKLSQDIFTSDSENSKSVKADTDEVPLYGFTDIFRR